MNGTVAFVLAILVVAFVFDFVNGFHDSANSIATVVSTRVLSPSLAVVWAAFFNFVAAFGFGTAVAKTMGSGLIRVELIDPQVVVAGLIGAIAWDVITWVYGIPSSSSHALMGGYAGAAIVKAGAGALVPAGWVKPILFIVVSPLIAPVIVWVVETGIPKCDAMKIEIAPALSAQNPPYGRSFVMRWPIVFTMRHPPSSVPRAMAACAQRMTHSGITVIVVMCRNRSGKSLNATCAENSRPTTIPIVFWASFVPCPKL